MKPFHFSALLLSTLALACGSADDGSKGSDSEGGGDDPTNTDPDGPSSDVATSARAITSSELPACDDDTDGALYYLTDEDEFRVCIEENWETIDLTGPAGADGQDGADGVNGADGTNGSDGADGTNGSDGADGATWLSGAGAPSVGLGVEGDFYLDQTTGDVYRKGSSDWGSPVTNLTGPAGADGVDGATWTTGSGTPDGASGSDGDFYLDVDTGLVFEKQLGTWTVVGDMATWEAGGQRWIEFSLTSTFTPASYNDSFTTGPAGVEAQWTLPQAGTRGVISFFTTGMYTAGGVDLRGLSTVQLDGLSSSGTVSLTMEFRSAALDAGCYFPIGGTVVNVQGGGETCYGGATLSETLATTSQVHINSIAGSATVATISLSGIQFQY